MKRRRQGVRNAPMRRGLKSELRRHASGADPPIGVRNAPMRRGLKCLPVSVLVNCHWMWSKGKRPDEKGTEIRWLDHARLVGRCWIATE